MRRQKKSPFECGHQFRRGGYHENTSATVFLGHFCIGNPWGLLRGIKYIAHYWERGRARWIRKTSPSSVVTERNDKVKEQGERKEVNGVDEKGHDVAGECWLIAGAGERREL